MTKRLVLAAALCAPIALGGCAGFMDKITAGAAKVDPVLRSACSDALMVAGLAGLVPGVGAIVPYINAGCATAEGLTKLAADPSSAAWVGELVGQVKGLAAAFGKKL